MRCACCSLSSLVLCLLLTLGVAPRAAQPPRSAAPAAPKSPPVVTVIRNDGSTVRGQLDSSNPKALSITTLVKGVPGDTVEVPWGEVKSVSNGLTRQQVIGRWKVEHPEDVCDDCRGAATTFCPTCKGTGRDASSAADCPTCHGEMLVACPQPKCDHGKIPCPRPCLKLSEGKWRLKDDGLHWRMFTGRGGSSYDVSENHLGQIIEMKDGVPQAPVPCPTCKGAQKIDCPHLSRRRPRPLPHLHYRSQIEPLRRLQARPRRLQDLRGHRTEVAGERSRDGRREPGRPGHRLRNFAERSEDSGKRAGRRPLLKRWERWRA